MSVDSQIIKTWENVSFSPESSREQASQWVYVGGQPPVTG